MCGKSVGGRVRIALPKASATAAGIQGSFRTIPANRRKAWTCSCGSSSRWSAQAASRSSPCRSYARYKTDRSESIPFLRRISSNREIRSSRIAVSSSCAGTAAIVPHQSKVAPLSTMGSLDVEDDLRNSLLLIDGQPMPRHGFDDEFEFVPFLVDRLAAGTALERAVGRVHIKRGEKEVPGLVNVQEFGEPAEEQRRRGLRGEAGRDLADRPGRISVCGQAKHPPGPVRGEVAQGPPIRPDPHIRPVVGFFL